MTIDTRLQQAARWWDERYGTELMEKKMRVDGDNKVIFMLVAQLLMVAFGLLIEHVNPGFASFKAAHGNILMNIGIYAPMVWLALLLTIVSERRKNKSLASEWKKARQSCLNEAMS